MRISELLLGTMLIGSLMSGGQEAPKKKKSSQVVTEKPKADSVNSKKNLKPVPMSLPSALDSLRKKKTKSVDYCPPCGMG